MMLFILLFVFDGCSHDSLWGLMPTVLDDHARTFLSHTLGGIRRRFLVKEYRAKWCVYEKLVRVTRENFRAKKKRSRPYDFEFICILDFGSLSLLFDLNTQSHKKQTNLQTNSIPRSKEDETFFQYQFHRINAYSCPFRVG